MSLFFNSLIFHFIGTLRLITLRANDKDGSHWGRRRAKSFGQLRAATFTPRWVGATRGPLICDAP